MTSDLRYTESTDRKCRRLALCRAKKCRTCNSGEAIRVVEPCMGCQQPLATLTCVPGYCGTCSHDPRWLKVGTGATRMAAGRRADQ